MIERVLYSNILAAGLYGAETTHVCGQALAKLRSAMATALGPKSKKRNVDLAFELTDSSKDLDPWAHIIYNRVCNVRRALAKNDTYKDIVAAIICKYDEDPITKTNAKPFSLWDEVVPHAPNAEHQAKGPIGLMIDSLKSINLCIDKDLDITCNNTRLGFNLWTIPWQHIKKVIFQFVSQTRIGKVDIDRTFCGPIGSIESGIVKSIINQFQTKERHIYSHIATGGFWHEGQLSNIQLSNGQCKHCGKKLMLTTAMSCGTAP